MLAHELRNPLAPVSYAIEILNARGPEIPEASWARTVIQRQVRHMTRLVDDLLDVSRITRGTLSLKRERVDLAAVLSEAIEASRPAIEASGNQLQIDLPNGAVPLDADPIRLAQAFTNLLTNAAKYTDRGGRITLAARCRAGQVEVSVRDTGTGIPPAMLGKVFEMFAQVDRTLERSRGGLGVGLALVKTIVELHGGEVEARSDGPSLGSVFSVRLPIVAEIAATSTKTSTSGAHPSHRHRILVAEDGRDAAQSFAMLLTIMGHEVRIAYDGQEAVAEASSFRPGVIIMDVGMPIMNGYDAARQIRSEPWGKDIFLIALTGWGQGDDRRRSHDAGFNRHLTKPVDPSALETLLGSLSRDG
jgi:CheY-like chemotaxis protein/two-component sensor histidine kinase